MYKPNFLAEQRRTEKRIGWMLENGLQHWAGTISPAPKSIERNEIESLYEAILYYHSNGIKDIVIQPKFMGSYCAIYLNENIEETKFFSRNGYLINHLDREKLLNAVKEIHSKVINDGTFFAIVEAELMPWSALGEGLIQYEYENYYKLHTDNFLYLFKNEIPFKLRKIAESKEYQDWLINGTQKQHIDRQYKSVKALLNEVLIPLKDYQKMLEIYRTELDKYNQKSDPWFEPFNICFINKKFHADNLSAVGLNKHRFDYISLEEFPLLEDNPSIFKAYKIKEDWKDIEGIMVKPLRAGNVGIAHALKVRTDNYLQVIYGIKFQSNYEYYLTRRNISGKMRSAIEDYSINLALLTFYKDYNLKKKLFYRAIDCEHFERTLDTRL